MEDYGLVSIITPTWNCGAFIAETIESVQAQTYGNWEMLIVDDCSKDNTREIVAEYQRKDPRIKYHCLERNSGAAVARNTALRMAKGRWIAFLDSDDLWMPEKLERQINFMVENNYLFSCTDRIVIDEHSNPLHKYISGPKHINKFGMFCYCWIGCLTVMYDADRIGLIQIADVKKNNDYAIWLKVIKKGDCHLLAENLGSYRIRAGSISRHSAVSLIKWHYRMFRKSENMGILKASFFTVLNIVCGVYKKTKYVKYAKN